MTIIKNLKPLVFSFIVFGMISSFSSCKKYEDGPSLSVASKKGRVANNWKMEAEYKNGVQQQLDADDLAYRIEFSKDGAVTEKFTDTGTGVVSSYTGTWDFSSDKETLTTTITYGPGDIDVETYKILRLKSNELWLEQTDSNGNKTEIHFVAA